MSAWPSLAALLPVAERLGERDALAAWLAEQRGRVGDAGFAALFDGIDLPGVARIDFAHRHVRTGRGDLLGGIRFFGQDVARPFVEVVAHGLDLDRLRAVAASEWAAFSPLALRLLVPPAVALPGDAALDMTVHAARMGAMAPPDGRARLGPIEPAEAHRLVVERHEAMEAALRRDVSPARLEDLERCAKHGILRAICAGGQTVGVLATEPGAVAFLSGDVVAEEVVAARFAGRGLAASAQGALAARGDPARPLVGTIHARNAASRRTAERAGRAEVLRYVFLPLPAGGGAPRPR